MAESTLDLLAAFPRHTGCEAYGQDSKRIQLLTMYVWLRQFTERLTFELFLEKFAPLANYDATNLKHPDDALHVYCPRVKKQADAAGVPQWTAKECVDILALYADMCREADKLGMAVPITFAEFLQSEGPLYKTGQTAPLPAATTRQKRTRAAAAASKADPVTGLTPTVAAERPTSSGQWIIYEPITETGRQIRGTTVAVYAQAVGEEIRQYVDFVTEEGEVYNAVNASHCTVLEGTAPPAAEAQVVKQLRIPKDEYPQIVERLKLNAPVANVPVGEVLHAFTVTFKEQQLVADLTVVNQEAHPVVIAELANAQNDVIADLPPRRNILGDYCFNTPAGVLVVRVITAADQANGMPG